MKVFAPLLLFGLVPALAGAQPAPTQADLDAATSGAIRTIVGLGNQVAQDQNMIRGLRAQLQDKDRQIIELKKPPQEKPQNAPAARP